MRAVVLMFDSLNRHYLHPYGCEWTHTPNFSRLAARTATFDNSYICSMACVPARRDLHTGRPNFLHRAWGPLEPYDDSFPEILREAGIYTHLVTDHQHYWEDGGANYHTRYSSCDLIRGQEGDPWIGQVADPLMPERVIPRSDKLARQDVVNRQVTRIEKNHPLNRTFQSGIDFIKQNKNSDRWMLQIEAFDPHEPYFSPDRYKELYREHFEKYQGKPVDWPPYREVCESPEAVEHAQFEYAALLSMCDQRLGQVLDIFDEHDLWQDTMLIVWTDHGFLLGEHGCWAKSWLPFYNEIARTPFFVWDPRSPVAGQRRKALVQPSIDIAPTLLNYFGLETGRDMLGNDLAATVATDHPVREYALFGMFGWHVNITDGRYVYMRGSSRQANQPLFEYRLMPARMRRRFLPEELSSGVTLEPPFAFTKGCPTLKIPVVYGTAEGHPSSAPLETMLFDLHTDPQQCSFIRDAVVEERLIGNMASLMRECDAPAEQFQRLGLS